MPTVHIWRGDCQPRAQVVRVTPADVQENDEFIVTINRKDYHYIATAAGIDNVVLGLVDLIGVYGQRDSLVPSIPEFNELAATIERDDDNNIVAMLVTGPLDGTPFTLTATTVEGGIALEIEEVTAGDPGQNEIQRITLPSGLTGGTFTLEFDGQTSAAIAYNATNYTVRDALCDLSNILGTDEVQRLTSTATGGTFTITFEGQTTGAIAFNASAATIQTALEALSNIAVGDVVCAGGPLNVAFVSITFRAVLGRSDRTEVTIDNTSATGGTVVPSTTTAGVNSDVTVTGSAGGPYTVEFIRTYANQDVVLMTGNGASLVKPAGSYGVAVTTTTNGVDAVNEKQQVTLAGPPTGGTFTLAFDGQTSGAIAYDASAATVQAALEALSNIAPGDVVVTGNATGPYIVEFKGTYRGIDVPLLIGVGSSLTGGAAGTVLLDTQGRAGTPLIYRVTPVAGGTSTFEMQFRGSAYQFFPKNATAAELQALMESVYGADIVPGDIIVTKPTSSWLIEFAGQWLYQESGLPGPYLTENTTPDAVTIEVYQEGDPTTVNEVQTASLLNGPTGGTFTLTFRGATTAAIAYNASAAVVDAALEPLGTIGAGQVAVTGSAGGPWDVEFTGTLAGTDVTLMSISTAGLTGSRVQAVTIQNSAEGENEIERVALSGSPAGGTFTLTFESNTTGNIAYNASAIIVKAALVALGTLGTGNVDVVGSDGGPWNVEFKGTRQWEDVLQMTGSGALLSGAAVDISTIQEAIPTVDEVQSVTITAATGGTFTLTYGGQTTSAIPRSASAATVQAALEALSSVLVGNMIVTGDAGGPWFCQFYDALGAQNLALMTGSSAGLTGDGTQSLTVTAVTSPTGPNWWTDAENWMANVVKAAGDTIVFENSTVSCLYGIEDDAATQFLLLQEKASYTGHIGLPIWNEHGYFEYRPRALKSRFTTVVIGEGPGSGSEFTRLDLQAFQSTITVLNTADPANTADSALHILNTHASSIVRVFKGNVGIAAEVEGQTSQIATLQIGLKDSEEQDAVVITGKGLVQATIAKSGGYLETWAGFTTGTQEKGTWRAMGTGNATKVLVYGGDCYWNLVGTATKMRTADGGIVYCRENMETKVIDSLTMEAGSGFLDPYGVATPTALELDRCSLVEVKLDLGSHIQIVTTKLAA